MEMVGRTSFTSHDSTTSRYGGRVGRVLQVAIISERGGKTAALRTRGHGLLGAYLLLFSSSYPLVVTALSLDTGVSSG